jgi:ABC-type multidrug transport system fused ATPase/permease subunit
VSSPSPVIKVDKLRKRAIKDVQAKESGASKKTNQSAKVNLIEDKEVNHGAVTWNDVRKFLSFSAGVFGFVVYALTSIIVALLQLACSYVLSTWAKQDLVEQQRKLYPNLLISATVAYFVLSFARAIMGVMIINVSSKNMYRKMTESVLRARILFFDSNPLGRIVTRFTKDIAVIDLLLTYYIVMISYGILKLIVTVITIAVMTPIILIPTLIVFVLMIYLVKLAIPAVVEAQRLDSVIRGPIHQTFTMIVQGLVSFRSMDKLGFYRSDFKKDVEKGVNVTFTYNGVSRWISQRIDYSIALLTSCIAIAAICYKGKLPTDQLAFILQVITDVLVLFSFACRCLIEL